MNKEKMSAVAVFAYNRPVHLENCINSLLQNENIEQTEMYFFVDGPKSSSDEIAIDQIRQILDSVNGFKSKKIKFSINNLGLSRSLMRGIDFVLSSHDRIIVLEDDIQVSSNFLSFMNIGLSEFESNEKIASIQGFTMIQNMISNRPLLIRGADCWGWATWSDRWQNYKEELDQFNIEQELLTYSESSKRLIYSGHKDLLKLSINKQVDSWAVYWHLINYYHGRFSVHPPRSFIRNMGFDGTGTNSNSTCIFEQKNINHKKYVSFNKLSNGRFKQLQIDIFYFLLYKLMKIAQFIMKHKSKRI